MHNILFIKGLYPAHFKYEILQEHRHALIIFPIYSFKVSSLTFIKHVKNLFDPKKQYFEMFLMVRAFLPLIILQASWEKCYLMHNVYLKFRKTNDHSIYSTTLSTMKSYYILSNIMTSNYYVEKLSNLIFAKSISGENFGFVNKVFRSILIVFWGRLHFQFFRYHVTLTICLWVMVKDYNDFSDYIVILFPNWTSRIN